MRFEGNIWKEKKHWLVEVPILDVMTQGRTRKEALAMLGDAIEALVDQKGFKVDVYPVDRHCLEVGSRDVATIIAFMLRRWRQKHRLSLAQIAEQLGQGSRNAFARYEQGAAVPTVTKLAELLSAIEPGHDFVLRPSKAA